MRLTPVLLAILNLLIATSTTLGSVTFQNLPTSPTQLFSGGASHGYLIHDLNGGHFIQSVHTVESTTIDSNVATTTYTYPETPDTQPYPLITPNGPLYLGSLYPSYLAGISHESLITGPSTLFATADWSFSVPAQEVSNSAGISFDMTVTNAPATLSLEQDIYAFIAIFKQGQYIASSDPNLNSYEINLPPGQYQVQYTLYDHNTLSGHYSLNVVPEASSAWMTVGGLSVLGILAHQHRRRTN